MPRNAPTGPGATLPPDPGVRIHGANAVQCRTLEPLLVGLPEVAHLIGVSERTVKRMAAADELPGQRKIGRRLLFHLPEIKKWVEGGCKPLTPRIARRAH
jgi:excisionase family DNA binding protein